MGMEPNAGIVVICVNRNYARSLSSEIAYRQDEEIDTARPEH